LLFKRTIYERFAQDTSNAEQEALCFSAIDEIDPNIRFCAYKLQLNQDIATLVTDHKNDQLQDQLAKIKSASSSTKQAIKTLTWRSHEFSIKNAALAQAVVKAQNTRANAQLEHGAIAAFDAVLSAWADTEKLAKKAVKENKEATAKVTSSKSAKATEDLNQLFTYVEYNVFGSFIERNLALAEEVQKNGKPHQQVIKLYDDILKVKKKKKKKEGK
jgi:signal recognition particle subunit SRP68